MTSRKNILFLTHRVPYPPNRGDRIRSWNILQFLSERANVHLACLTDEPVDPESTAVLERHCEQVHIQPLSTFSRWIRGGVCLLIGKSATEGLFASAELAAIVRRWASETRFDAVLVFCSSMYQFVNCRELRDVPCVVDLVDVDSEKFLNYAESAAYWKRPLYRLEANRVRKLETNIAKSATAVTLVSENEVDVFKQFCDNSNVHAVQNGVDLDYFHPQNTDTNPQSAINNPQSFKLAFVGVLDYRANLEGLKWFCKDVWPLVREQIPHCELDLVGRRPNDAAAKLAEIPGVNLIGEVDDVRPHVWNADVVIAPLTIARGIQNKVLEAMAMAKPIVATPQAIEGTGAIPGEHLISATTPAEWTAALTELRQNPRKRKSVTDAAYDHAIRHFAWRTRLRPLEALLSCQPQPYRKRPLEQPVMEASALS